MKHWHMLIHGSKTSRELKRSMYGDVIWVVIHVGCRMYGAKQIIGFASNDAIYAVRMIFTLARGWYRV